MINQLDYMHSIAEKYFNKLDYDYLILPIIKKIILEIGETLSSLDYYHPSKNIWIHRSCKIDSTSKIIGPCIIGKNTILKNNCYIRENVIIGENSIIGNNIEIKNSILFDNCCIPHLTYIGDSILGYNVHLSAGVIVSNLRLDKKTIKIKYKDEIIDTGLKKLGAIISDNVEIGCNCVLNPGTVIGKNTIIYPLSNVQGFIDSNIIYKGYKYNQID